MLQAGCKQEAAELSQQLKGEHGAVGDVAGPDALSLTPISPRNKTGSERYQEMRVSAVRCDQQVEACVLKANAKQEAAELSQRLKEQAAQRKAYEDARWFGKHDGVY